MENTDTAIKISFKEGAYTFYRDFILNTVFNDSQRHEYHTAADAYDNCFIIAKQNKTTEAEKAYLECCEIKKSLTPVVSIWVASLCEPRLSYYYYKIKDYKTAVCVTKKIIEANQLLQEQGYQYLFFSEIQQYHNLSRIYFTLNRNQDAIDVCVKCLADIQERANKWKPGLMIDDVPEEFIIADSQYAMTVQVLTETLIRILRTFKTEKAIFQYWLKQFIEPLTAIKFSDISTERRYKHIDSLVSFLKEMILEKNEPDYKNLLITERSNVDKFLMGVLHEYIEFSVLDNEKALVDACS